MLLKNGRLSRASDKLENLRMKIFTMKAFYSKDRKKSRGPASNACKSPNLTVGEG
jgi:hypothetical protein